MRHLVLKGKFEQRRMSSFDRLGLGLTAFKRIVGCEG